MAKNPTQKPKLQVLYQNLGGVWYAFAQNGEEIYFGRVPLQSSPEEALELLKSQKSLTQKAGSPNKNTKRTALKNAA